MPIVYRHIRKDKNEPFYIGIGKCESRAYSKKRRSVYWKNIAKNGYDIEILFYDLTWEQACEKEKEFIALYGRKDLKTGPLVNLTDGGDGTIGYRHTNETKQVLKLATSGVNHPFHNKKRQDHSYKMKGENNPCFGKYGKDHPSFGQVGYWKNKTTSVAKKIIYNNIQFESQAKLAKYLNKSRSYITKLIKHNKLEKHG